MAVTSFSVVTVLVTVGRAELEATAEELVGANEGYMESNTISLQKHNKLNRTKARKR